MAANRTIIRRAKTFFTAKNDVEIEFGYIGERVNKRFPKLDERRVPEDKEKLSPGTMGIPRTTVLKQ